MCDNLAVFILIPDCFKTRDAQQDSAQKSMVVEACS